MRAAGLLLLPRALLRPSTPTAPPPRCHTIATAPALDTTLEALAERYDAFLIDQFGVIHDGAQAYEGAVDAMSYLQRRGRKVVIISNSSRRKGDTVARLRSMGFGPVDGGDVASSDGSVPAISVVTSGDIVFDGLCDDPAEPPFTGLGDRCLVFGNGADDAEYVAGCGRAAADADTADFILARGLFTIVGEGGVSGAYSAAEEERALQTALKRAPGGLPLLVANPDEVRPDGADSPMPGQLARRYESLGGADVRRVGKPHGLIYERCRAALGAAGLPSSARVLAVGDSLHHDVLGAARHDIASLLVCNGVHSAELGVAQGGDGEPDAAALEALLRRFAAESDAAPTHVMRAFRLA